VCLPWLRLGGVEQILEQRAVVNHRDSQIFCGRLTALLSHRDIVCGAIVLDDMWVIDGYVSGALVEVSDRVAAHLHQVGDESIGFHDGAFGIVDEACLIGSPGVGESISIFDGEWLDVQLLYAVNAIIQLAFCVSSVAMLPNEALVFRAELSAQLVASTFFHQHDGDDHDGQRDENANDYSGVECVHAEPSSCLSRQIGRDAVCCGGRHSGERHVKCHARQKRVDDKAASSECSDEAARVS
jgi:hypothetical protein